MRTARITTTIFIFLLALSSGRSAVAQVPEPAPCHGPPGHLFTKDDPTPSPPAHDRGYDVLSYDLDLYLDPNPTNYNGQLIMGVQSLGPNLNVIHLDLVSNLECLSVASNGAPLFFEHNGDSLLVSLPEPWAEAQIETLTIAWQGRPIPHGSFRAGLMYRLHHAGTLEDPSDDMPVIASVSETWSAHSWWPCKDHPADKALVSLSATVPDTLSVVSNGSLLGISPAQTGWRTYHWRETYPLPTYLVSVAASNYSHWSETCQVSVPSGAAPWIDLGFHVFPHDRPDGEIDLAVTCEAMQFMTDLAGAYPYQGEKYDQVEIKWAGAMEHPTATSLPTLFFTGTGQFETLLVHELSHHWFGNSLTPALWQDIWLNEGFARYCEALWIEQRQGRSAYVEFMHLIGLDYNEDLFVGDGLLGDPDPILPNLLVYNKGAWLLHSLRLLLGDDDFFSLLKAYANDPALVHGQVVTADFIQLAEMYAGRSLHHFFNPWLHTETVAKIHAEVSLHPQGETGAVRLTFQQLQDVWLDVAIPVTVHCADNQSVQILSMTQRSQEFYLRGECAVDSVTVDPEGVAFMELADAGARFLEVAGPYPNPFLSLGTEFQIHLLGSSDIRLKIFDARGRQVHQGGPGLLDATGPAHEAESTPHHWHFSPNQVDGFPAGVYWFEFRAQGHRAVKKVTFVH